MTIGEALKKIRSELGLTQKEMCGDIMSQSYYARVESTMILWEEERLDFFINQLLSNIKKNNVNMDYLLKIYLNIFNNYLFIYKKDIQLLMICLHK